MQGEKRQRWEELCRMAVDEQDPDRLMQLVEQITTLLEEKEKRLQQQRQS